MFKPELLSPAGTLQNMRYAFAYGADAVLQTDPADAEPLRATSAFVGSLKPSTLPPIADFAVVDDGSAVAGEVMNLLSRRNLLYALVKAPEKRFRLNIAMGSREYPVEDAADPSAFATGGRQVVVQTDAGGFARAFLRLGTEAGGHTVSASALLGPAGAQTTETETFMATAQPSARASQLVIVSGDNQTVPIDTLSPPDSPLNRGRQPNPLVVQVLDDFGNPVQGVAVQWRVSDGGGAMFSFTTFSDPLGFATNVYTGVTEGANAIIAIAAGTQPVQFDITGKVIVDPEEDTGDGGDGGGGGGGG